MLSAYKILEHNVFLKLHFLHSYLDFFSENLVTIPDEHGQILLEHCIDEEKKVCKEMEPKPISQLLLEFNRRVVLIKESLQGMLKYLHLPHHWRSISKFGDHNWNQHTNTLRLAKLIPARKKQF
ncbi:hypothetical protein ABEB36_003035 [Hypothenemus hampei]|uniref:Uncharacterized protein n=1 Tax=Hypothenemus hampei TaxID=57062 RepID=A0ABD1F7S1_HYPHA